MRLVISLNLVSPNHYCSYTLTISITVTLVKSSLSKLSKILRIKKKTPPSSKNAKSKGKKTVIKVKPAAEENTASYTSVISAKGNQQKKTSAPCFPIVAGRASTSYPRERGEGEEHKVAETCAGIPKPFGSAERARLLGFPTISARTSRNPVMAKGGSTTACREPGLLKNLVATDDTEDFDWVNVLKQLGYHTKMDEDEARRRSSSLCVNIVNKDMGSLSSDSVDQLVLSTMGMQLRKGKRKREDQQQTDELFDGVVYTDLSMEEKRERRRYCSTLIEEQKEELVLKREKHKQLQRAIQEIRDEIKIALRSTPRATNFTDNNIMSVYKVELGVTYLHKKLSEAKEELYAIEDEVSMRIEKVRELSDVIAKLKVVDVEDLFKAAIERDEEKLETAPSPVEEERVSSPLVRPLGAHSSRIRSITENMQRYMPYSYSQCEESDSDEEGRKDYDINTALDNARKHLEKSDERKDRSGAHFVPRVAYDDQSIQSTDDEFYS